MPIDAHPATNLPLIERDGHRVLDLDNYIPFLLSAIGNKWSRSSSGLYLKEFGVGVTEWRIIAMLAIEPRITAYRICQVIGLDKAATSRALKAMEGRRACRSAFSISPLMRSAFSSARGMEAHSRAVFSSTVRSKRAAN